uniref:Uncharacterized protein n=1 Tax=Anopheles funestus TaxID=62324 RepID=A0A4Y0BRD9_ANOFN
MHMLDEPQTMKTITVSMPKSPAANDHSFDNLTKTNVANAPTTCTHCTCFHELVSEQKKMLALFSTFEKKIVDGMQQMQETLMHKLKQIEEII